MKAVAVKNDEFKTIGLQVKEDNNIIFSWGISPEGFGWVKQVTSKEFGSNVVELIQLKKEIAVRERFVSDFFDVCKENGIDCSKGIDFKRNNEQIEQLKKKMISIIEKFK